jgi:heme-degrading monooxygenase HmoA
MIKHIVMWDMLGDTPAEKAAAAEVVRSAFHSMRGRIPGMRHLEIGVDTSRIDYACDVVLYSEFESQEALDAYAKHPEHIRAKEAVGNLRVSRHQVDYPAA